LPSWQLKPVDSTEQFRGLDAVSRRVAWVGGSKGSVFRTVDGGETWQNVSPPATAVQLLFRDVEAFGPNRAVVLAVGEADASRIYRTEDGGKSWTAFDPASGGLDSVECAGDGSCWASEQNGKVARLAFPPHSSAALH
jgi:photosystem II stability/assembly factor-like uncharacterized protein